MRFSFFRTSRQVPETDPLSLLTVTPPRSGERTLVGVENMLQAIASPEPFSLEVAADADGAALMVRCPAEEIVRGQLSAHYPQAIVKEIGPEDDPLRARADETVSGVSLRSAGPEHAPLRTFRDRDLLDPGSDPFIGVLGAMAPLARGERIVAQILLRPLGPDWSFRHVTAAYQTPSTRTDSLPPHGAPVAGPGDPKAMAVFGAVALAGLRAYTWVQAGETWKAVALGTVLVLGLGAGAWVWNRWHSGREGSFDPAAVREKVSSPAFDAEIRITAFLPHEGDGDAVRRAGELVERVAAAYRRFDNPAGARLDTGRIFEEAPDTDDVAPTAPGFLRPHSIFGAREVAGLWHPPGAGDETPLVERSGAKALLPSARGVRGGAYVGDTLASKPRHVEFPEDLLRRHHFYVARTRMGKSTLMRHIVEHKMSEKAAGRDGDAIVVVDPHADLVDGLLELVPPDIADSVRLIDLADPRGAPGINLVDTRVFSDRDRTADSVVRVAKGLWEQWGPRMQSILEHAVKTLHEANEHPDTDEHAQHTILDGLRLLSDDAFRAGILAKVSDPFILEWWARDFGSWHRNYRAEALAPVQTRLSYYASSKRARSVLGQPRCTVDIREIIADGGVLFVSTAQGTVGRDVSALVGASLLNLVDAVVREQGALTPAERRGVLVVVDEMQSMPGVDYEAMLSELGKFGASFVLATQSLSRLDDLSATMRDSLMANVGCLSVFQVAGIDARRLVYELGRDRVSEEDIVSLPVHCCYVRATVGADRMPAFSMKVRPPGTGSPATAARIRAAAASYITPAEEIEARQAEGRVRVERYRSGVEALAETPAAEPARPARSERSRRRTRRRRNSEDEAR